MSNRLPKSYLVARFTRLAKEMGWQTGQRWTRTGDQNVATIDHVALEHNSVYGWNINQIMSATGGERCLLESCTARELNAWMTGALFVLQTQEDAQRKGRAA